MVKKGWEMTSLGKVAELQRGYDLPSRLRKNGKIPIVSSSGVTDTHIESRVSGPGVVTGRYGTIGQVFFINEDFWPLNTTLYVKDFKGNDPLFISFLLKTIDYETYSGKSGVPGVNRNDLHGVTINLPNLEEQRTISIALSDVYALIAMLDKLIIKKRAIKTATMQQLLTGKRRLPGFGGQWKSKRIGDLLTVRHGKSQHSIVDDNGDYPIMATSGKIGRAKSYLYDKPSVLIGRKGTINKPQYIEHPFWTIDTLFYTEIEENNYPKFIFYKFCTINWLNYNEASGVPSLNASTIENIEFLCPDKKEQISIATILADIDAEITALESRSNKTQAIKQGMMQELLTGGTRLI